MGFLNWIIEELVSIRDWFYNFYLIVHDWVWPFYLIELPIYGIYGGFLWLVTWFTDFRDWVDYAANEIERILSIGQIMRMLGKWLDYATWAWDWVTDAWNNLKEDVLNWWETIWPIIWSWIKIAEQALQDLISALDRRLTDLKEVVDNLLAQLPSMQEIIIWFSDWWGNIKTRLTTWWGERLVGINELIGSWFKDYAAFWEGWQEIRDQVITFFTDPWQWFYDRAEDFFDRFW